MKPKIRVLFLQSQARGKSIEDVHSMLASHFDYNRVEVHAACAINMKKEKTLTYQMFEAIPDVHIRPTNFGPTVFKGSKVDITRNMLFSGLALSSSLVGLIGYIKRHRIDIIHTADKRDILCGILLARLTGARCIVHLHLKCGAWMTPISLWGLRQADGIIGVSQFTAQSAITVGGCRPERVFHVLSSVDISRWDCDADGSSIRQEFGIATEVPVFAIIARVVPWKGHEILLQALSKVKDELPDFKLLIVGGEDPSALLKGSSSYIEFLKEKIEELGLNQQVIFTGPRPDVEAILATSNLFIMPAVEESFGLAFAEALAMKKPVIALESGGTGEVVENDQSGLLSQPGDVEQLAENILTLVNDPVRCKQMGEYGRKRVEGYFNSQRMANDVERVYRSILGELVEPQVESRPDVETVF